MFLRYATLVFSIAVSAAACGLSASPQENKPGPAGEALGTAEAAATTCGALREVCCANDVCDNGLVCDATGGLCRVGVGCGSPNEACCVQGRCEADLDCVSNLCKPCGATGEACCGLGTSSPCDPGNTCANGTCACGGLGEACCATGAACGSNLNCTSGTCTACGAINEPCCTSGSACAGALECESGTCMRTCIGACCNGGCGVP